MNRSILILSFYFEPDLSAGSFRNTLLVRLLQNEMANYDVNDKIILITTMPNRYGNFDAEALHYESNGRLIIHRINVKSHNSGFLDQTTSYLKYVYKVYKIQKQYKYDTIYASSSRLMTAFLGVLLKKRYGKKIYLDIRDIFRESITDVVNSKIFNPFLNFFLGLIEKFTFKNADVINVVTPGMVEYFTKYKSNIRCFTNGIDEIFFNYNFKNDIENEVKIVTYAGNIGKAQALEKVIPFFASKFAAKIQVLVVGAGSGKQSLLNELQRLNVKNVQIIDPKPRNEILEIYKRSDFLFLNLDDKPAFHRAIPSKLFEYASTGKVIVAGLKGFAKEFVLEHIKDAIVFDSNDYDGLISRFNNFVPNLEERELFLDRYRRKKILTEMSIDILALHDGAADQDRQI